MANRKQKSIKKKLINLISLSLGIVLCICFFIIDQNLDGWADKQFKDEISSQAFIFKSVVLMNANELSRLKDNELLSTASTQTTYYQIWKDNALIKKSNNLKAENKSNLVKYDIPLNSTRIIHVTLPNGDEGIATLTEFTNKSRRDKARNSIFYVTIYHSTKKLNNVLYIIDALLIMSFVVSILLTRILAQKIVSISLKPLFDLNDEIIAISKTPQTPKPISDNILYYKEIVPIQSSINHFIAVNQNLIKNEKRITGDIAHELKTPLAEIISMTEVYEKFPNDPRIAQRYTQDMLEIANEMKLLIDGLLYLHEKQNDKLTHKETCSVKDRVMDVLKTLAIQENHYQLKLCHSVDKLLASPLSLSMILRNLIDNANFYKTPHTAITIMSKKVADNLIIMISNHTPEKITDNQLSDLIKPLFKIDKSRKNTQHYGLGLTIVNNLCSINGYTFTLRQDHDQMFHAILKIKLVS